MKKLSASEHLATLSVLVPGAIGLWIVGRTLASYFHSDPMASVIVGAMGLVLVIGLVELLVRHYRAAWLQLEVERLPASPSEATVDGASGLLGGLLRARLEQSPGTGFGESITPYLTGLLVMLGLLGTLLGLFDTVHGASHALTASADVSALRQSLSTPIAGLTRSFGCSAAGISASAMLGLALALVRRREAAALRVVQGYAMGPLRALTPARRQARALEQLANQGLTLPQASTALEQVGTQLAELSKQLVTLQTAGVEAQHKAFSELLAELRSELGRVAAEAGSALHERVAPLMAQTLERSNEAARVQAGALAEVARDIARELGEDAVARRREFESEASERRREAVELVAALGARMDSAERERAASQHRELEALGELASRTLREAAARDDSLSQRWAELLERADQSTLAVREEESARLARLDGLTTRIGDDLTKLTSALDQQLAQRGQSERARDAETVSLLGRLGESASAFEASIVRQRDGIEQLVGKLPSLFNEVAEASQRGAQTAIEALVARTDERLGRITAALDGELAQRIERERAHDARTLTTMEQLDQGARLLEQNIKEQRGTIEGFVERAGGLVAELATAARESAQTTLARLADSAEEQAMRWAKLESELADGRLEHARGLEEQLTAHAERLERQLGNAGAVVSQAAAIWKASSTEMQAIAELFASSVERQREASESWLESLGDIEAAVERSGRHAAADALADQLASTQEVFARQLQFQRELFEQLRSLRASTRVGGVSEQEGGAADVSV